MARRKPGRVLVTTGFRSREEFATMEAARLWIGRDITMRASLTEMPDMIEAARLVAAGDVTAAVDILHDRYKVEVSRARKWLRAARKVRKEVTRKKETE